MIEHSVHISRGDHKGSIVEENVRFWRNFDPIKRSSDSSVCHVEHVKSVGVLSALNGDSLESRHVESAVI